MTRNKIVAIIQARVGSTRLPNKILLKLEGKTVLEHILARVSHSKFINSLLVAAPSSSVNEPIVRLCSRLEIGVYLGAQDDVLDRYYQTALCAGASYIVRITSDCPLIDPTIIDAVIKYHLEKEGDYTSNTIEPTFPDGEDVEIVNFSTLRDTWKAATLPSEREHVTPYIIKHPEKYKLNNLTNTVNLSLKRWTLDYPKDYDFVKRIYAGLYRKKHFFTMDDIITYLKTNPKIEMINASLKRNEGYQKSLQQDKKITTKHNG